MVLEGKVLRYAGEVYRVAGVHVSVDLGGTHSRTTATRVVLGTAINAGSGTLIGAMAKKQTGYVYLTVEFPNGGQIVLESKANYEILARDFAAAVNSASRAAAR
jgi:hypothetical protein